MFFFSFFSFLLNNSNLIHFYQVSPVSIELQVFSLFLLFFSNRFLVVIFPSILLQIPSAFSVYRLVFSFFLPFSIQFRVFPFIEFLLTFPYALAFYSATRFTFWLDYSPNFFLLASDILSHDFLFMILQMLYLFILFLLIFSSFLLMMESQHRYEIFLPFFRIFFCYV